MNWKLKVDSGPIEAKGKTPDDRYFSTESLEDSSDKIVIAPKEAQIDFPTGKWLKTFFINVA